MMHGRRERVDPVLLRPAGVARDTRREPGAAPARNGGRHLPGDRRRVLGRDAAPQRRRRPPVADPGPRRLRPPGRGGRPFGRGAGPGRPNASGFVALREGAERGYVQYVLVDAQAGWLIGCDAPASDVAALEPTVERMISTFRFAH